MTARRWLPGAGLLGHRDRLGRVGRDIVEVRPHGDAHFVALRAAVSTSVPLVVLGLAGRLDLSMYAAFGAFTALYGRNHVHVPRLRMQLRLGALLTLVVGAGVLVGVSPHRAWLAVPLAALLASGCTLLSERQDWHPPGALFPVFAFTACASLASRPRDVVVALAVAGASAAFAVVVGNVGAFWRRRHVPRRERSGPRPPTHRPVQVRRFPRSGVAVLLAGALATGVGIGHPYWAMVSAVVPLVARDFSAQLVRGTQRVIGTFLGLAVTGVLLALDPSAWVVIALIVALQTGAELLIGRNYALALTCVTPLALLALHLASGGSDPWELVVDRGVETVIGVVIGLGVGFLARPSAREIIGRRGLPG
ncbi:FUSC family protein [Nocardioides ochotonae]|uniref:FUSC family protein n=1 Tax=Nocardioides ochotonae TaxID=2685869 RepID=UPI00140DDF86|nr:FUSC family protein [Nocardioides ochotonae]